MDSRATSRTAFNKSLSEHQLCRAEAVSPLTVRLQLSLDKPSHKMHARDMEIRRYAYHSLAHLNLYA